MDRGTPRTLEVLGISQRFGERIVLDAVELEVPPGRVIGLLGPNGAGKTTLMRIVFGVIPPDSGTVRWGRRLATRADRSSWGYMPQERGLYRDMRVHDHLTWLARLHGLDRRTAAERASDLLRRLDLADRGDDAIKDLSGGMAQRVQLAAAMVHRPDLLVLDEPFSGLDPASVAFLSGVISDQIDRGGNLILSSHQLDLVENICEDIVLIHEGRVVLRGSVSGLKAASAERVLRVDAGVDAAWLAGTPSKLSDRDASGSRIRLEPDADAATVLDAVRRHAPVGDFAVESPTLSDLFLAATGQRPDEPSDRELDEVGVTS